MIDFQKLFTDYKIPFSTRVSKGWVNSNCPFCDTKSTSFNMGFQPDDEFCNCWKCGSHPLDEVLASLLHIDRKQVGSIVKQYKGTNSLNTSSKTYKKSRTSTLFLPSDEFTKAERKYLISRDFDPDYLHEKYGIVGGGITGKWKFRIVIPIYYNGRLVSWVARSILSKEELKELDIPRYKNLSNEESIINVKDIFYNLDNCRGKEVILTEGCFDVLRFDGNAICSLGTQMTQNQIKILSERFSKVYILFDNEEEAQHKAHKFGMQISSMGIDVEVIDVFGDFGKNDMGDCTKEEISIIKKELGL